MSYEKDKKNVKQSNFTDENRPKFRKKNSAAKKNYREPVDNSRKPCDKRSSPKRAAAHAPRRANQRRAATGRRHADKSRVSKVDYARRHRSGRNYKTKKPASASGNRLSSYTDNYLNNNALKAEKSSRHSASFIYLATAGCVLLILIIVLAVAFFGNKNKEKNRRSAEAETAEVYEYMPQYSNNASKTDKSAADYRDEPEGFDDDYGDSADSADQENEDDYQENEDDYQDEARGESRGRRTPEKAAAAESVEKAGALYLPAVFKDDFNPEELLSRYVCFAPLHPEDEMPADFFLEKEADKQVPCASLTKIMTVLVAIESVPDLSASAPVDTDTYLEMVENNSSMAGFFGGESTSYEDLIYGTLLASGGEAANSLAINIAGSQDAYVDMMNMKAAKLGLENTRFMNVEGLDEKQHYSSARDIYKLLKYALENPVFEKIIKTPVYNTGPTNNHPDGVEIVSTVLRRLEPRDQPDFVIEGGKSGTTFEAGECWATIGSKNGIDYIAVVMGSMFEDINELPGGQRLDTLYLFNELNY